MTWIELFMFTKWKYSSYDLILTIIDQLTKIIYNKLLLIN